MSVYISLINIVCVLDFSKFISHTATEREPGLRPGRRRPNTGGELAPPSAGVRVLPAFPGELRLPAGRWQARDRPEVCTAAARAVRQRGPQGA